MYKLDKFSDMDIVTLEELEEIEEDGEESAKIKLKNMKRWKIISLQRGYYQYPVHWS